MVSYLRLALKTFQKKKRGRGRGNRRIKNGKKFMVVEAGDGYKGVQ